MQELASPPLKLPEPKKEPADRWAHHHNFQMHVPCTPQSSQTAQRSPQDKGRQRGTVCHVRPSDQVPRLKSTAAGGQSRSWSSTASTLTLYSNIWQQCAVSTSRMMLWSGTCTWGVSSARAKPSRAPTEKSKNKRERTREREEGTGCHMCPPLHSYQRATKTLPSKHASGAAHRRSISKLREQHPCHTAKCRCL